MSTLHLILAEIRFRLVNSLLCLLAVAVAAALFVVGPTLISGYARDTRTQLQLLRAEADRLEAQAEQLEAEAQASKAETERLLAEMDTETTRIMRDLGVNLRIVHRDTNMTNLYTDFVAVDFPEDYVHQLAKSQQIETIVHVVATLQDKIKWNGRSVLLVGTLPVLTESQKNEEKPHMIKNVDQGTVLVGHELGADLQAGDTIQVESVSLTVARIMPEYGSLQDVQLVTHLEDAQQILGKPGRINQIMALNCKCKGNRISVIRQELEGVLPDTKVTEHLTNAEAREKQRDVVEAARERELAQVTGTLAKISETRARQLESHQRQATSRARQQQTLAQLVSVMTPVVVLASALFVGLLTWLNVRERRSEIGVLRALGKGALRVGTLFLGKAFLLGLLGGLVGCSIAYLLTPLIGQWTMQIPPELFRVPPLVLAATLVGAPLVSVLAGYLPTLAAVAQDPSVVLMDA